MKKIVYHRKCIRHKFNGKYDWSAAVWFNTGMFADATIHGRGEKDTIEEVQDDMEKTLALFGVTKKTPSDGTPTGGEEKSTRKRKQKVKK